MILAALRGSIALPVALAFGAGVATRFATGNLVESRLEMLMFVGLATATEALRSAAPPRAFSLRRCVAMAAAAMAGVVLAKLRLEPHLVSGAVHRIAPRLHVLRL